jgi:hypothetical protein
MNTGIGKGMGDGKGVGDKPTQNRIKQTKINLQPVFVPKVKNPQEVDKDFTQGTACQIERQMGYLAISRIINNNNERRERIKR